MTLTLTKIDQQFWKLSGKDRSLRRCSYIHLVSLGTDLQILIMWLWNGLVCSHSSHHYVGSFSLLQQPLRHIFDSSSPNQFILAPLGLNFVLPSTAAPVLWMLSVPKVTILPSTPQPHLVPLLIWNGKERYMGWRHQHTLYLLASL